MLRNGSGATSTTPRRGGKLALDGRAEDLCFGPSIVLDVPGDALILQEEVFGPVAAVVPVDSVDEAIAVANDSELGLQAACFTSNLATAMRVAEELQAGSVWINEPTRLSGHVSLRGLRHERDRA